MYTSVVRNNLLIIFERISNVFMEKKKLSTEEALYGSIYIVI